MLCTIRKDGDGEDNGDYVVELNEKDYDYAKDSTFTKILERFPKVILGKNFSSSIGFLPYGITHIIYLSSTEQSFDNVPSTTKSLIIRLNLVNNPKIDTTWFSIKNLPHGLENLEITIDIISSNMFEFLPSTLKYLTITSSDIIDYTNAGDELPFFWLSTLPDSIEVIILKTNILIHDDARKIDWIDYIDKVPANLKEFHLYEYFAELYIPKLNAKFGSKTPNDWRPIFIKHYPDD